MSALPDPTYADNEAAGEHAVPVPCKCCGKVHPECGCWLYRNMDNLEGHDCLVALKNHKYDPGMIAWHPKYPGQQRSALYFHKDQLRRAQIDIRIYHAALEILSANSEEPNWEFTRAARGEAQQRLDAAKQQFRASLSFLDTNDVTGRLHTLLPLSDKGTSE